MRGADGLLKKLKNFAMAFLMMSVFSMFTGLVVMCAMWLISGMKMPFSSALNVYRSCTTACMMASIAYVIVRTCVKCSEIKTMSRILLYEGVTPQLLSVLRSRADKASSPAAKGAAQLDLAAYLVEGEFYEQAFQVLSSVDFTKLTHIVQEEYYNIYVYANLMMGDIDAAERIYSEASRYFERARLRRNNSPVLHTIAVLQYARGNYVQAETLLIQAKNSAASKSSLCCCDLYLGLCYLKTGRPEYAKRAAIAASKNISTVYQKSDLEKLMRLVEKEYTIKQIN